MRWVWLPARFLVILHYLMKILNFILSVAMSGLLWSCSGGATIENAEAEQAAEQAEQMISGLPDVDKAAREHARSLRPEAYQDSLQLHALLLDAAATRSRYELAGQKKNAERFNEVFLRELKHVNPQLAASLNQ